MCGKLGLKMVDCFELERSSEWKSVCEVAAANVNEKMSIHEMEHMKKLYYTWGMRGSVCCTRIIIQSKNLD